MEEQRILRDHRVLRYTFTERLVHWVAGVSYVYLLLNGLALWSPYMWWIAAILGGGPLARATHPWVGLVFVVSVLYMYMLWKQDMVITETDRRWGKTIGAYVRNEEEELSPVEARRSFDMWAPVDRFNLGQKHLFWVMFWSGIVLLLTGLVLWWTEYIPWSLRFLRYIAVVIHPVAFLVTMGGFIIHVYMGTAVVRGGFTSVIRGEVSERWARHYHRLWLDRIMRGVSAKK
jgi:formate dehydrogenase subunit gamma